MRKNVNFLEIIKILSLMCITMSSILIIPLAYALSFNEQSSALAFASTSAFFLSLGGLGYALTRRFHVKLNMPSSMLACLLSWLLSSCIGAIPFMLALDKGFIDSLFESVSGFTTTGITVFTGLDQMPKSVLLWRNLTQWLGGLGILTFFLLVTFKSESDIWKLFGAESHKAHVSRPVPNIHSTIRILWGIYVFITVLEIAFLRLFGVSLYDSVLHSFSTVSTGGFSPYDQSLLQFYKSKYPNYKLIEYCVTFFMFISGVNFLLHYRLIVGGIRGYLKDMEFRSYFKITLFFSAIVYAESIFIGGFGYLDENVFRKSLFQVVSIVTTTGFSTEYIGSDFFGSSAQLLFPALMLIGGCIGSTAGGVKILRIAILGKLFSREILKTAVPKSVVIPVTLDNIRVGNEEVLKVCSIFFGWILVIFTGAVITGALSDLGPFESLSGMLSAVGNIGPFYFSVEQMASLSPVIKLTYIAGMLCGRLEILPVFIILSMRSKLL
ncbi:trk system potassium uptake protein TrkH [Peptoclostridium litorale DSM 5388]|uniref:Trk system potassium uptake protein TrkH n=1 Tax=Peptoclostridium litorale DSM 5388 TaxID=1121324 RepID=A0A069RPQ4_PEPLI|nr:TrkH family potassium uptake protein [Peptoclostridium litorale]KDR96137.1 Trk system potassium uptake protein TrkH [Peptoclostridium litorale DSM 5388]SIO03828.1 trk system potassium uptake protein TrkH [Peptoclostridium litorale DSM 5388]